MESLSLSFILSSFLSISVTVCLLDVSDDLGGRRSKGMLRCPICKLANSVIFFLLFSIRGTSYYPLGHQFDQSLHNLINVYYDTQIFQVYDFDFDESSNFNFYHVYNILLFCRP